MAHFIEIKYNEFESKWHRSRTVSEALVQEIARLAQEHGVKLIVANIKKGGATMLSFAERKRIPNVDISVDRALAENTNRPHDSHPSAFANRQYADKLEIFLRSEFLE